MRAWYEKHELTFKRPAKTSRGEYATRPVWLLFLNDGGKTGVGECAPMEGLSPETPAQVEKTLEAIGKNPKLFIEDRTLTENISSVRFALETALQDLVYDDEKILFPSEFTGAQRGIPVNGLVWMGSEEFMKEQVDEKLRSGFKCIKLKTGSLDFSREIALIKHIRQHAGSEKIVIRLDANGAFNTEEALSKLEQLAQFKIHSIEQPVAPRQWDAMTSLCRETPIPVALDEELTGVYSPSEKQRLLDTVRPQFIVLKPSLHGGFSGCSEWIDLAEQRGIGWWVTSYLESNIGLNAIAQWTFHKHAQGFQGLGTGTLFTGNFKSPLEMRGGELWFRNDEIFEAE